MYLNSNHKMVWVRARNHLSKAFIITKVCAMLLLLFTSQISASASWYSKVVSLNVNKASLKDVLISIREQSGVDFVYNEDQIKNVGKITLECEGEISVVMDLCLKGTKLQHELVDNIIVIKPGIIYQEEKKIITGQVVDEKGQPIPGVNVIIQGEGKGTVTDFSGKYTISVKGSAALRFSFIGYKNQVILVGEKKVLDVKMFPEIENMDEVVVVAFGEQKKESVVSAITTVRPELLKSSNSDLTTSFVGNVAGLIGWQTGGMPGAMTEEEMNTRFYIRGITSFQTNANIDPLILLDGVEVSKLDLARVNPDDIESFSVLKDASATAMYGARGANGIISVTTKKGVAGDVYVTGSYERIYSMPTNEIDVVDPITWMRKYNEASNSVDGSTLYTAEYIRKTESGKYPSYLYPANDWYNQLFKPFSINNHYNVGARGGGDRVQYYISLTHNRDNGILKVDQLNQFDPNIQSNQTGFISNISVDMTKTSKLILNSIINYDDYTGPAVDAREIYGSAFQANPVGFASVYPMDDTHTWPHIRFGGFTEAQPGNPYADIQKGYSDRRRYSAITKAEYIQELHQFVKGLQMRASASINQVGSFGKIFVTTPAFYNLPETNYDFTTGEFLLKPLNKNTATRTLQEESLGTTGKTAVDYQLRLFHTAAWGQNKTSLTFVSGLREEAQSGGSGYLNSLPHRNITLSARGAYEWNNKYFVEFTGGFNGSERFAKGNKMGFFPAMGGAWIASNEDFMANTANWLSFLKFRLSYGKTGNDGIYQAEPRFVYLDDIQHTIGMPLSNQRTSAAYTFVNNYPDPTITWEVAEQTNLGVETRFFNGLVEVVADVYEEIRHNIFATKTTVPASVGLTKAPMGNVGKVKSRGVDLSGKIQHAVNQDFWFILNGTFTYNRAKFLELQEASEKPWYQLREGRDISQQFGYIAEGLFQDQQEVNSSPVQSGDVRPGDIRYKDINNDGVIDVNDVVAIGHPETPSIVYGLNGISNYKNFEFSFAFQGTGKRAFWINPKNVSPFDNNRAMLTAIANDYWSVENPSEKPLWPRLSTYNITQHNPQEDFYDPNSREVRKSTYFMRNGKYLRCTKLELAYYLNKERIEKYKLKNFKVFARATNPFVISDFNLWDIELGENGFNYPIQRTISLGAVVSF